MAKRKDRIMNHLDPMVVSAFIGGVSSVVVAVVSIYLSNRLVIYRLNELEKKMDKHNSVMERTAILERDSKTIWRLYDDVNEKLDHLEHEKK